VYNNGISIKMDLISLHLYMEVFSAACLFFIAGMNIVEKTTGKYSLLIASGCFISGIIELIHGMVPYIYPWIINEEWMAISGSMSRLTLCIMLGLMLLCYEKVKCNFKFLVIGMLIPIIISILPLLYPINLSWTYSQIDILWFTVTRPLDAILLVVWIIIAIKLKNKSHVIFPPHTYGLFMILGILIHALMAFSIKYDFDNMVFVAHALKIAQYYSFILIYLIYKNNFDNTKHLTRRNKKININTNTNYLMSNKR